MHSVLARKPRHHPFFIQLFFLGLLEKNRYPKYNVFPDMPARFGVVVSSSTIFATYAQSYPLNRSSRCTFTLQDDRFDDDDDDLFQIKQCCGRGDTSCSNLGGIIWSAVRPRRVWTQKTESY